MTLTRLCFFIIGILLLLGGVATLHDDLHLEQIGLRTTGVVVANDPDYGRTTVYYPEVQFVARGGHTYVVRDTAGANPPQLREGQTVTVYYDPRHPQTARIDSDALWMEPVTLLTVGSVIALAAAWPVLRRLRGRTHTHTRTSTMRSGRAAPVRRRSTASARRTR